MKWLTLLFMLTIGSVTIGCGPGGPPPVAEPNDADPIDDVDVSMEEGLENPEDAGGGSE